MQFSIKLAADQTKEYVQSTRKDLAMGLSHEMLFDTVIIGVCVLAAIIITHRDPGD